MSSGRPRISLTWGGIRIDGHLNGSILELPSDAFEPAPSPTTINCRCTITLVAHARPDPHTGKPVDLADPRVW